MKLLVTGGAGFIGSALVRRRLATTTDDVIVLDKLTYAGSRANLADVEAGYGPSGRFRFVLGDIADPAVVGPAMAEVDAVINLAAESHVDRSILDAQASVRTGVVGVHVLLQAVRDASRARPIRFLQVSTDEVYGPLEDGRSAETDTLAPRSPYAAAKAAGELLCLAFHATYGTDVVVTRGANTFGPRQHPEKLIPLFITNALQDRSLPLYGDGLQTREWLYVDDHADGIGHVLDQGRPGEVYNLAGRHACTNRAVTEAILDALSKPWSLVRTVADRPGHDRRYALDGSKLAALGWQPRVSFDEGLAQTIEWFVGNPDWWRAARSGEWHRYYERQYAERLASSAEA